MVVSVDHDSEAAGICHDIRRVVSFIGSFFSEMAHAYDYGTILSLQLVDLSLRRSVQLFSLGKSQAGCIFWHRSSCGTGRIQPEHADLCAV